MRGQAAPALHQSLEGCRAVTQAGGHLEPWVASSAAARIEPCCRALQIDLAARRRGVARDCCDEGPTVREAEDPLYQPLAKRSAADDARTAVVVERACEYLARRGRAAVDPHL